MQKYKTVGTSAKKILVLTCGFPCADGGIARMIQNICTHSQRFVPVVLTRRSLHTSPPGCHYTVIQYPLRRRGGIIKNAIFFLYAVFLAFRHRVKMILCIDIRDAYIALPLITLRNTPLAVLLHGHEIEESFASHPFLSKLVLRKSSLFLASSNYTRDKAIRLGAAGNKIKTLFPGTFLLTDTNDSVEHIIRNRYHLNGKKVILTVSRLVSYKGIDAVIQALARLSSQRDDIVYLVVGRGPDEARLRRLTKELNVSDNVVFCGFVPDNELPAYYKACDVFAMVSRSETTEANTGSFEGFGIAYAEAAAAGKPSVAGICGGAVEAVIDRQTGILINPLSVDEVATALTTLLENPSLAEQLGENGRRRVSQMTWPIYVDKLERFLNELL